MAIVGNHWVEMLNDTATAYWPDQVVGYGVTAAHMAIKDAVSSYPTCSLEDALLFAGHVDESLMVRAASAEVRKITNALDLCLDLLPRVEVTSIWDMLEAAPEPAHIVAIRARLAEATAHFQAAKQACEMIIAAAREAGEPACSETQTVA